MSLPAQTENSLLHPTAIIHPEARLGKDVRIGPYAVVGAGVTLHDRVDVRGHVHVEGHTTVGEGTVIYPFASVGSPPQDLKYQGEPTRLTVGKNTTIREHVTLNTGTVGGGNLTSVGDNVLLMVGVHVGHDCHVGNHVIMANNATLGGHVVVEDNAVLGGLCAVHQFCRIGEGAMVGGMTGVENDVIPYGMVMGNRASLVGLNLVGLERRGVEKAHIHGLRALHKQLFVQEDGRLFEEKLRALMEAGTENPLIAKVFQFLTGETKRRFVMARPKG